MELEDDEERRQETHGGETMDVDGRKTPTQDRREPDRTWPDANDEKYKRSWPGATCDGPCS